MRKKINIPVFCTCLIYMLLPVCSYAQYVDLLLERIAHYPMDNGVNDISGYENHGQAYGATLTADRFGNGNQAYYLDGEDDYINCGVNIEAITSTVTVSCWIRTDATNNYSHILSKYDYTTDGGFILGTQDGQVMWAGRLGSDQFIRISSRSRINDGKWHHLVGTIDGNNWLVYVDGILENQVESGNRRTNLQNSEPLTIGMYYRGNNGDHLNFGGNIDEVIIYRRVLNLCEIQMLYTGDLMVR